MKLAWFDRNGKQLEEIAETDDYYQVRLSPDDKKLASVVGQPSPIIWIYDVARDSKSRFTFDDKAHSNPVWSRDGNQLAYALSNGGVLARQSSAKLRTELAGQNNSWPVHRTMRRSLLPPIGRPMAAG